jgi:hypothetical protein
VLLIINFKGVKTMTKRKQPSAHTRLDIEDLAELDAKAKACGRSRSRHIGEILQGSINGVGPKEVSDQLAGMRRDIFTLRQEVTELIALQRKTQEQIAQCMRRVNWLISQLDVHEVEVNGEGQDAEERH